MPEIVNVYKQNVVALKFIGKKYNDDDRVNGNFGTKWGEWHENGWFDTVRKQFRGNLAETFEDGGSSIGLMRGGHDSPFEYWIGVFMPEETAIPDGFMSIDFPAGSLGVCWIYGGEDEVFMLEGKCGERLEKEGFDVNTEWCFERYACPRYTTPDEKGNIILDICFYLK